MCTGRLRARIHTILGRGGGGYGQEDYDHTVRGYQAKEEEEDENVMNEYRYTKSKLSDDTAPHLPLARLGERVVRGLHLARVHASVETAQPRQPERLLGVLSVFAAVHRSGDSAVDDSEAGEDEQGHERRARFQGLTHVYFWLDVSTYLCGMRFLSAWSVSVLGLS